MSYLLVHESCYASRFFLERSALAPLLSVLLLKKGDEKWKLIYYITLSYQYIIRIYIIRYTGDNSRFVKIKYELFSGMYFFYHKDLLPRNCKAVRISAISSLIVKRKMHVRTRIYSATNIELLLQRPVCRSSRKIDDRYSKPVYNCLIYR